MPDGHDDGSIAPRRSLSGPILPPPPPELSEDARRAEQEKAAAQRAEAERKSAREAARTQEARADKERIERERAEATEAKAEATQAKAVARAETKAQKAQARAERPSRSRTKPVVRPVSKQGGAPRRTRRAQLRLVQVDAWSVMKTSFLLSIALGIVLVVAVAIIWSVLGAAGVWESINSIVQQAVGSDDGKPFDIQEYARHLARARLHDDRGRARRHPDHRDRDPRSVPLQPLGGAARRHRGHPRRGQLIRGFVGAPDMG